MLTGKELESLGFPIHVGPCVTCGEKVMTIDYKQCELVWSADSGKVSVWEAPNGAQVRQYLPPWPHYQGVHQETEYHLP